MKTLSNPSNTFFGISILKKLVYVISNSYKMGKIFFVTECVFEQVTGSLAEF